MIGVACLAADLDVAREFFELFKTPWEWLVPGKSYSAVLSADGHTDPAGAAVALVYGGSEHPIDRRLGVSVQATNGPADVRWGDAAVPVYGTVATFPGQMANSMLACERAAIDYAAGSGARRIRRIGYDLFGEIRHLLHTGQPAQRAQTPTLELHIALLQHLLLASGVPFLEVPPRPLGRDFACCLTHDVDFVGVRRHWFDRTLAGFMARASVGTFVDWLRGRRTLAEVAQNWRTLCFLPLVFARLLPDFWRPFDDYRHADRGRPSTFFVVPFKGRPGLGPDGTVSATRAVAYQASEIGPDITAAQAAGSELAVHGIDAWRDADAGRAEMAELTSVTGQSEVGIRMHWLYFADDSPKRLEAAGFGYDSTCGYNDAVGYRAGTSQAFRLPGTERLLELPLAIMDSALLSPDRMALSPDAAVNECRRVIANARRFGGTVVINWHCRSLAPERLWRRTYEELLHEVGRDDKAWFATAGEVVNWFRWRRSVQFSSESASSTVVKAQPQVANPSCTGMVRVHRPGPDGPAVEDLPLDDGSPCRVDLGSFESTI